MKDAPETAASGGVGRGPLAWMAKNSVAANLCMIVLLGGGLLALPRIKHEVFPDFDLDIVLVNVPYPGASPAEVEQGVILAVEEAVRGLDGVKEVRSTASEGAGTVMVELLEGANGDRVLADVKSSVDRITSYPEDIERPVVSLLAIRRDVMAVIVFGDVSEEEIRVLADRVRDELLEDERITYVELSGVRPREISVEVSQANLRQYGLTLEGIARSIRAASVEVPGGEVRTRGGQILLRTAERRNVGREFSDIVLLSRPDGSQVRVRDVARVVDGFRETDQEAYFNGQRAAIVEVYRIGDQTPMSVAEAVKDYIARTKDRLPPGVGIAIEDDHSEIYKQRVDLLLGNAYFGLALVLLILGLFLEIRLAFWVTMGIPISFLGALFVLPWTDASINMISLFGFIVTLGMVVDDAIIVGEAVHHLRQKGLGRLEAAVRGVREVAGPVTFSILTSCIAFLPLFFIPGVMGKFFWAIPLVVILVLLVSLFESLFILPAHLAHSSPSQRGLGRFVHEQQQRFSRLLEWLLERTYRPVVGTVLRFRYLALATGIAMLVACLGLVAGGHIRFTLMPRIERDSVRASVQMPFGTPVEQTRRVEARLVKLGRDLLEELGGADRIGRGVFSKVGSARMGFGPGSGSGSGSHLAEVTVHLCPSDERPFTSAEFARRWREKVGEIAGAETVNFGFAMGAGSDAAITIELSHPDMATLEAAAARLAATLGTYAGAEDVNDGFQAGKPQLDFRIKPEARSAGLTEIDLARQVRSAYFGAEALRQQRGRDEIRVYVRAPEQERGSLHSLEQLVVRTPNGGEVPLGQAASLSWGRSYTSIQRKDGRRTVSVTADVTEGEANANEIVASVLGSALPRLAADYPGLGYSLGGQQERQAESFAALGNGFLMALLGILALLAVAFRSYAQPAIVMAAIPFGGVGAILGHLLMGYDLSLMSLMGMVALSGVVVNDSLLLVVAVNRNREAGMSLSEALVEGGVRRFRPILLTSLTTFFGLMPMILETSVQARFLIPMALSLGFGVMFATLITLLLVPTLYAMLEDLKGLVRKAWAFARGEAAAPTA